MRGTISSYRIVAVALFGGVISGCDSLTGNKEKSIAITVDNAALTVGQGTRDSILITITRTNFDQPITLSVEGTLPVGVTRTFSRNPIPAGSTTSYLRFIATGAATPGATSITIRATGDGVAEKGQPIDLTVTVTGSYSLSMLNPSLTVAQGGGGDAIVLLTRTGGNASGVSLAVSGAPSGVTASGPSPTSDRAATVTVTANASVAPGTYPLTITGSAVGITPSPETQLSLVVISPPTTTTISVPFCSTGLPIWFAYKNEGFGWQPVAASGNSFTFAATEKTAVAYVFQGGNEFQTNVSFLTRTELLGLNDLHCGSKSLTGSIVGMTAGQTAVVRMGFSSGVTTSANYSLQGVASRPLDLVAARGVLSTDDLFTPDKMILQRSLDLASTIPELDFNAAESFAPATSNLTINGFSTGFVLLFDNRFWSATSTYGTIHSGLASGGTATLSSVPASKLVSGDRHELLVDAFQSDGRVGHALFTFFDVPGDRSETLGPLLTNPTVAMLASSPPRVRAQLPSQAEYGKVGLFYFEQGLPPNRRILFLFGTADHYGGTPTTWDFVAPDFSAVPGFVATWLPAAGQVTAYYAEAFDGRGAVVLGGIPNIGEVVRLAYRVPTAALLLRGDSPRPVRRRLPLFPNQYLR